MDRSSLLFCAAAIGLSLAIAVLAWPYAAIPQQRLELSRQVMPAEDLGEVDLGEFGRVPVLELVEYYLENPPAPVAAGAPVRKVRFQGC
ncbi:MAG TPA: hypothetical protein ENI96_06780 [Sedimenticola thiotaurini]|uniref:Uncharacterized protein n=1 Tax=Sedimenticola thiotaurini TaxID=1543721 RepID=A0A831RJ06_9GAMM|nr:hypothetical protein [Sedimenticola thiotaurini]